MIVNTLANSKLFFEIIEGIEGMGGVEFLIVFAVAALHLAVMSGGIGPNELMANTQAGQLGLEDGRGITAFREKPFRKLRPIVRLDTFNGIRKSLDNVL